MAREVQAGPESRAPPRPEGNTGKVGREAGGQGRDHQACTRAHRGLPAPKTSQPQPRPPLPVGASQQLTAWTGVTPAGTEPRGPVPQAPQASPTSGPVATTQQHGGGTVPAQHPVSTRDKCGPPRTARGTQQGSNRRPEQRAGVAGGVPRGRRAHESARELLPWETSNAARKTRAHHPRHERITQETARAAPSEAPRGAPCSRQGQGGSGRPEGMEAQGGPRRVGGWQREGLGTDRLWGGSGHGWTHRPSSGWRAPPWPWAGCFLAQFQWRPGRWLSHLKQ